MNELTWLKLNPYKFFQMSLPWHLIKLEQYIISSPVKIRRKKKSFFLGSNRAWCILLRNLKLNQLRLNNLTTRSLAPIIIVGDQSMLSIIHYWIWTLKNVNQQKKFRSALLFYFFIFYVGVLRANRFYNVLWNVDMTPSSYL